MTGARALLMTLAQGTSGKSGVVAFKGKPT
jgi:hypothetical protein